MNVKYLKISIICTISQKKIFLQISSHSDRDILLSPPPLHPPLFLKQVGLSIRQKKVLMQESEIICF